MKVAYPKSGFEDGFKPFSEGGYGESNSSVVLIQRAESSESPLTAVLRRGFRGLLLEGIEAEVESLLAEYREE